ncbi:ABC transporter permease [Amycolatopsis sp. NPDC051071]|uniref:ABC transporter permease n=1 Tax=Amycolatopsis sp. NPDC051071 TaxID=3154637 RepID=UPI003422AD72
MKRALQQTWVVFVRASRPWLRSPVSIVVGLFGPIVYLVLFGPVLDALYPVKGEAWQWFVPGMLLQLTLFGGAYAGFSITPEIRSGVMERMRVTPASRAGLLFGRVASDVVQLFVQGVILLGVAALFDFRADAGAVLAALVLVAGLGAALSSASYALAIKLKEENKFAPLLSMALVPLLLLSGVLLPMDKAPSWLRTLSEINPLAQVANALRAITSGQYGSQALVGTLVTIGLIVVLGAWGLRTMAREHH